MATMNLTLEAPDAAVPLIRRTMAALLNEPEATTGAETKAAVEKYIKQDLKARLLDQRRFESESALAADQTDGVVSW